MIDDGEFNEEYGPHTSEEESQNLDDGRYEKTIFVNTWTGMTRRNSLDRQRKRSIYD